jgi:hypothetical protein
MYRYGCISSSSPIFPKLERCTLFFLLINRICLIQKEPLNCSPPIVDYISTVPKSRFAIKELKPINPAKVNGLFIYALKNSYAVYPIIEYHQAQQ